MSIAVAVSAPAVSVGRTPADTTLAGATVAAYDSAFPGQQTPTETTAADGNPDSLARSYTVSEVVVTATRSSAPAFVAPSPLTLLSGSSLSLRPGSLVAEAMAGLPGIAVRSYGGPGAVQTISLRGMSPEHTLVLVNGMRVANSQNGQTDFALLPSSTVERVEIARGGFSGLYGADAGGGVIHLQTRSPDSEWEGAVEVGGGNAGFRQLSLSAGGAASSVTWMLSAHREYGRGDYLYDFSDGRTVTRLTRTGADFGLSGVDASFRWSGPAGLQTEASLLLRTADRGSPGPVTDPSARGTARLADALGHLALQAGLPVGPTVRLGLAGSYVRTNQTFRDPAILMNNEPLRSESTTLSFIVSPVVRYIPSQRLSIQAGGEYGRSSVNGSEVRTTHRDEIALYGSAGWYIPLGGETFYEVVLFPSLRYDRTGNVGSALSPRLGVNVGLFRSPLVRLRASGGRSFRVPSFNDLYWIAGGNADLNPERILCFDAGVVAVFRAGGEFTLDLGGYSISASDRILWLPGPSGLWSPRNVGDVLSRGIELEAKWSGFSGHLQLGIQSTLSEAVKRSEDYPGDATEGKQLLYVPPQTVRVEAEVRLGSLAAYCSYLHVSHRYTTETNDRFLPSYGVTSAAIRWEFGGDAVRFHMKAEGTNLFDTSYQVIAQYPMPLRSFRFSSGIAF